MRATWAILPLLLAAPAAGQEQQARMPNPPAAGDAGDPVYELVAGDRETAWRINRQTGEVLVCRVDTTGSLDTPRARCAPVTMETPPQQSRVPAAQTPTGGGRP